MLDYSSEENQEKYNNLDREISGFSDQVKSLYSYCLELREFGFYRQACFACIDLGLLIEQEVEEFTFNKNKLPIKSTRNI
ncbi:MAG: hypothetical protein OCD03_07350 [Hyphomicrobiales bacterium]